jgi:dual specificity MAP kinase phosphatase
MQPIYATISDIVVYSPKGFTPASLALAERFKIAIEKKQAERRARLRTNSEDSGLDGPTSGPASDDLLTYNVFVLSATADELREVVPHLMVRLPSDIRPNTVDFAEREKKEMRELTRASEIISVFPPGAERPATMRWDPLVGQVFLGNANDVPFREASGLSSPALSAYTHSCHPSRQPSAADLRSPSAPHDNDDTPFDPNDPFDYTTNDPAHGRGYDICVECHEFAPFPSAVHFHAAEDHFRMLDAAWAQRCRRQIHPSARDGPLLPPRPPPNASTVIHLPFPSSPPSSTATLNALLPAVRFLERMLQPPSQPPTYDLTESESTQTSPGGRRWSSASSVLPNLPAPPLSASCPAAISLRAFAPPAHSLATRPLKILLYSSDGYTESSVPALCLLMAVRRLSLPEAYLELQVTKRRSFFVYQADLGVLRRVEARLAGERGPAAVGLAGAGAGGRGASGITFGASAGPAGSGSTGVGQAQHPYRRPAANSVSSAHSPAGVLPQARMVVPSQGHLVRSRPRASTSPWLPSLFADHQMWFNDPRFDGSFPSRVLPFLYLGNLYVSSHLPPC